MDAEAVHQIVLQLVDIGIFLGCAITFLVIVFLVLHKASCPPKTTGLPKFNQAVTARKINPQAVADIRQRVRDNISLSDGAVIDYSQATAEQLAQTDSTIADDTGEIWRPAVPDLGSEQFYASQQGHVYGTSNIASAPQSDYDPDTNTYASGVPWLELPADPEEQQTIHLGR